MIFLVLSGDIPACTAADLHVIPTYEDVAKHGFCELKDTCFQYEWIRFIHLPLLVAHRCSPGSIKCLSRVDELFFSTVCLAIGHLERS